MSGNGGENGRNSPSILGYTITAFNAAVGVFVAIVAMQGDETKGRIDELNGDMRALRTVLADTREKMIENSGRLNSLERERRRD